MPAPSIAVLIPAYREERFIADVVRRAKLQLATVVVIDDGSPDRTGELAQEAGAEVHRHERNKGKGAAIKTGLRLLLDRGFTHVLIMDGDAQHLPEEIPLFVEASKTGANIVVGNRTADIANMPFVRKLTNRTMSWLISKVCKQDVPDSQCGFRLIERSLIPHLFCHSQNYEYETEMLLIASREGFKIGSVPITTVYGEETSKIHPLRDTMRFFRLLLRYL